MSPPGDELPDIVGSELLKQLQSPWALHPDLSHMANVEQPGARAHREVLLDERAELNRHLPSGKVDELRTRFPDDLVEGSLSKAAGLLVQRAPPGDFRKEPESYRSTRKVSNLRREPFVSQLLSHHTSVRAVTKMPSSRHRGANRVSKTALVFVPYNLAVSSMQWGECADASNRPGGG